MNRDPWGFFLEGYFDVIPLYISHGLIFLAECLGMILMIFSIGLILTKQPLLKHSQRKYLSLYSLCIFLICVGITIPIGKDIRLAQIDSSSSEILINNPHIISESFNLFNESQQILGTYTFVSDKTYMNFLVSESPVLPTKEFSLAFWFQDLDTGQYIDRPFDDQLQWLMVLLPIGPGLDGIYVEAIQESYEINAPTSQSLHYFMIPRIRLIFPDSYGSTIRCNTSCQVIRLDPQTSTIPEFFVQILFLEDEENMLKQGFDEVQVIRDDDFYSLTIFRICVPIIFHGGILLVKKPKFSVISHK
ncbi:MAG: hypothetical protein ACW97Z_16420 [Candidatus Hodarchaeales archaeon]